MAYTNIPANLYDYFSTINQRIRKLESAPDQAMTTAQTASTQATTASTQATTALANAATAYAAAIGSLQPSASTIVNASNQMTAISTNGITVYSGSSASSGARVVMNSAGIAGYNSGGTATFAINASTGAASFAGSITGSTITGSTLNINGNFVVDASGYLTCTGASVTGNIYSSTGTIGGFTLSSTGLSNPSSSIYINSSSATVYGTTVNAGSGGMTSANTITATGTLTGNGYVYFPTTATTYTTSSSANLYINPTYGNLARSTSSARYKLDIEPQAIPVQSVMSLTAKSFIDKLEYKNNAESTQGLTRYLGLIAEEVAEIDTLKDFLVVYTEDGLPDAINYDRVAVALLPLVQDLQNRVTKLEGANGTRTTTTN